MRACGGMWVAYGSGTADRNFVNSEDKLGIPPDDAHYILKRVWLSKEEEKGFYLGFSNEGLWPLCHVTFTRPVFRESDWQAYKDVNRRFADALLAELPAQNPYVFIQDFHFTLLPRMIKEKRPDACVALFWHIPWPNPEVFSICPYQQAILDGMLGADLLGFHVQSHCNNFLETVNRTLESLVSAEKFTVVRNKRETAVRAYPISIDNFAYAETRRRSEKEIDAIITEHGLEGKLVGLGVERIDYTKGIAERFAALDRFFEKYPEYKGKVVFIQLASPSRADIPRYRELIGEIERAAQALNGKHATEGWKPLIYIKKSFSSGQLKPYYALADFCVVSALHDGMNLVAKEYIASKSDNTGMLVLSRFTGASKELTDAVLINPYSIEDFADALKYALTMPEEERRKRMKNMSRVIAENNVFKWAGAIISDLTSLRK
jgi:trehalose 6-phosphate synthase